MTRTEEFEELRPLLFSIAYRILGSVAEAEDAVQEAWLRYQAAPTQVRSPKAFLSAVITRIALDVLKSARVRREEYAQPWFPEPLLTDPYQDPERSAELAESVSMAALLLMERLSPLERAVFVLREVFGFGYAEVAAAVGRSEAACRQLVVRARKHMAEGRPRFEADTKAQRELADRFFDAFKLGDVEALQALLAADVVMQGDGGGKGPQFGRATTDGAACPAAPGPALLHTAPSSWCDRDERPSPAPRRHRAGTGPATARHRPGVTGRRGGSSRFCAVTTGSGPGPSSTEAAEPPNTARSES